MRSKLVKELKCFNAQPIENYLAAGTPDVTSTMGWMELKHKRTWPVRPTTPLRIAHFTHKQRMWHLKHARLGGVSWLILQIGKEWFIFTGEIGAAYLGNATREELHTLAALHLTNGFDRRKIQETLINGFQTAHGVIPALSHLWSK